MTGPFENKSSSDGGFLKMFGKLFLGCGAIALVAIVSIVVWTISTNNSEVDLRNRVLAQQDVCKADFDKMWKVIAQKAQVTDRYQTAFREIYSDLVRGRYENDKGEQILLKFVTESNPQFDASVYKDLMASVEGQREGFFQNQKMLRDLKRQHDTLMQSWPQSLVVGGREPVQIDMVLSSATDAAYETGREDDVTLPGGTNKP